ncbi:MAG: hypothetical protein KAT04_07810 [Methylococcales bacterium]|nr:hypothetical protein [Methylococcales bacterium]
MNNFLLERFNNSTVREKIMFHATLLFIIWGAWDNFFYQPIAEQQKHLSTELSTLKVKLSAQQLAATQIEASGKIDPNLANKKKLDEINSELKKLKKKLDIGEKKFVSAHLMAKVLRDMLKQNKRLTLINLETLPVTNLSELGQQKSWIFRHGLSITVSGHYFDTLKYLKSLESLPWRFNWDSINYQVKQHPMAETTFQVYTLSFEENWLGL